MRKSIARAEGGGEEKKDSQQAVRALLSLQNSVNSDAPPCRLIHRVGALILSELWKID